MENVLLECYVYSLVSGRAFGVWLLPMCRGSHYLWKEGRMEVKQICGGNEDLTINLPVGRPRGVVGCVLKLEAGPQGRI